MTTSASFSFKLLFWEVYVETTKIPVAQGLLPCITKEPCGSYMFLWWKVALIASPKPKKTNDETLSKACQAPKAVQSTS